MQLTRADFLRAALGAAGALALGRPLAAAAEERDAPVLHLDRTPLEERAVFDFWEYGFRVSGRLRERFEIVPSTLDGSEAFLFFFPRDDLEAGSFSLLNLHAFVKREGPLEAFARSLGESVRTVPLTETQILGRPGLTYSRRIRMRDLFEGGEQVIPFIGGTPELEVRDSHTYFRHRLNHYYTGLLHTSRDHARYDAIQASLLEGIELV